MNFAGPFDAKSLTDSPVSLDSGSFSFGAKPGFVQHLSSDAHVVIPDSHLLFSGTYVRIGSDLIISDADHKFVVGNYFKGESRPTLTSSDGATLSGKIVDALTGHVHVAQAGAPAAAQTIGHVLKMSGSASAVRNGVTVELHIGDAVQKGDVIQTGSDSSIGMTFVDGSAFGMTANARMVLNEMIFDPNGSSNSSLISLVQGTITFVAGQTAKNGNMRVETPVATMGIRGTAVLVEIAANDGPTKFSVLAEPDGHTGSFNLYDKTTGQLIGTVSQAGQVTFVSVGGIGQPPSAVEQLKTLADQEAAKAIINQVFQLYFPNFNPDNSNPKTQKFGSSSVNNLADIVFTTTTFNQQTFLNQIELRFAVTDPVTGAVTYQNRIFYNTKAIFTADTVTAEQSFVSSVKTFKISDVIHIDDPDIGNGPFFDTATPFVAGSAVIKSAVSTNPNLDANFLSQFLHINQQTGEVSFDRLGFNFLGQGETATFMLQVLSRSGPDSALVLIPIIITGDNDIPNGPPTIVVGPVTVVTGDVKEDTPVGAVSLATDGTITFRDVDLTDTHTVSHEFTSSSSTLPGFATGQHLGTFTIALDPENTTDTINTGTVQWHFSLPDNDPTLQSLAEGQTITQVYTITIKDNHGADVTQTVTVTITGTNDAPVLSADASTHVADEVPDTTGAPDTTVDVATGTLAFVDVDLSDTHHASAALHPGSASVVWSGGPSSGIPQATRDALNSAMTALVSEINTDTDNHGSVSWKFQLPDHLFDFLSNGETLTLIYDVTVTDNNGLSSVQQVTVQVGAANDQPVILTTSVSDFSAAVKEDVNLDAGFLKDTGSVAFTDADLSDTHTPHVVYNSATGVVSSALATALATALTFPSPSLAAGDHDFAWDFKLDTSLVQYLAEGETITATYTVTVTDSSGANNDTSEPQTVTVVITGTNDQPVITAVDVTGAVKEDVGSPLPVTQLHDAGSVTFADVDATDHETASVAFVTDVGSSGVAVSSDLHTALQHALTLQNSSFASNSGTVNWDFNLDNSLVQYLAEGETITVTYTVTVQDDSGVGATNTSAPQTVTVVITGTNDQPVITAVDVTGAVKEDLNVASGNKLHDSGSLTFADVDATDHETASVAFVSELGSSGVTVSSGLHTALQNALTLQTSSFASNGGTVNWDFKLDNSLIQYLGQGETITVTYAITVKDDSGVGATDTSAPQTVTVTITGTNDNPVLQSVTQTLNDTSAPDTFANLTGHLAGSDVDAHDTLTYFVQNQSGSAVHGPIAGAYGTLTVNSDGSYTYVPNSAAINALQDGQHRTDTFTIETHDNHGGSDTATFTVNLNGADDKPILNTSDVYMTQSFSNSGWTHNFTLHDLVGSDPDARNDTYTLKVTAQDGDLYIADNHNGYNGSTGLFVSGEGSETLNVTGSLNQINSALTGVQDGLTYRTGSFENGVEKITAVLTDTTPGHTGSDTVNFIFKQGGSGGATMTGTSGKDVFFGSSGQDQFVFAANSGQDTILNFVVGADKIDLQSSTGINAADLATLLAQADHTGGNTLLHLNGATDTLLVKGVAALHASDFILHA